jgi:hypothetical protein
MVQWVDCPSCQAAIPQITDLTGTQRCPHCGHALTVPHRFNVPPGDVGPVPSLGDIPPPRSVAKRRTQTAAPPQDASAELPSEEIVPTIEVAISESLVHRHPRRNSIWVWGLVAVSGALLTAILAVMFRPATRPEKTPAALVPALSDSTGQAETSLSGEPSVLEKEAAPLARPNDVDPWAGLRSATREDYFSLWNRIQPYLLRLDVKTLGGSRIAAGVLIDSRGLAATSFQAVRDAVSIEVRASSRSFSAGQPLSDLADNVRGLVAVDELHDVAILQVNRRFVSAFSTVSIPAEDSTLPGDRRVCGSPPSDTQRVWLSDFGIRNVLPFRELPTPIQESLSAIGLDQSDQMSWIVGESSHQRLNWGSPIFSLQGELVGLVTAASTAGDGIVAPGSAIAALIPKGSLSVREFPVDSDVADQLRAAAVTSELLPSAESAARPLAERLHSAMLGLGQNLPDRAPGERTAALSEFANALLLVDEKLSDGSLNEDQTRELAVFLAATLDRFQATMLTPTLIDRVSADAPPLDPAQGECGFVTVGEVVRVGHTEPAGSPFVIFAVAGPPQFLFTTIRHEGPIFLPGSRWVLIGQSVPETTHRSSDGVEAIEARVCDIHYVFVLSPVAQPENDTDHQE